MDLRNSDSLQPLPPIPTPECTVWCKSGKHAMQLMAAISSRPPSDRLECYCRALCHNFPLIVDTFGRNVLHFGSSCGDLAFIKWLLEKCHSEVDLKDWESGWTALHRSIYYGEIGCAQSLIQFGANIYATDREFCTPLDLIMFDRPPYIEYNRTDPSDCYVWGSNVNFNLGVETEQSRKTPEVINTFRRDGISVKEVLIRKFHSIFLTNNGKVFSCGIGNGGRLGLDSEDLCITPNPVKGLGDSQFCEAIASGQDHILLLVRHSDKSAHVYSCGMNTYHVLGHEKPVPEKLLAPKQISLKSLKLGSNHRLGDIIGIGAAKYHSLFYTEEELFTFGLNVGQIGHPRGERTQITAHKVSALNFRDTGIKLERVVSSDGAIVCATNRGDVWVLHEYQCRKVASQQFDIQQICVIGGHLDERTDVDGIHDYSRIELQIMLLTKMRNIYLWKGSDPTLVRCLCLYGRELSVTHICLNISSVGIVTKEGEVFFGNVLNRKSMKDIEPKKSSTEHNISRKSVRDIDSKRLTTDLKSSGKQMASKASAQQVKSFVKFVNKDECHTFRVKKQHFIHRAVAVFCDDKNRNFAVLQSFPKLGLLETASKPDSQMISDMRSLYETSGPNDGIHDVVIKVGNRQYFGHKFILSNRSDFFRKKLSLDPNCSSITFDTNFVSNDCFELIFKFIYCNSNDLFEDNRRLNWSRLKTNNSSDNKSKNTKKLKDQSINDPLKDLRDASKKLGVNWFHKWLTNNGVKLVGNTVKVLDNSCPPKLTFDRFKHEFYDIVIKSNENIEYKCHKCILMSRLEYFRGMLSSEWIETSTESSLTLPIPSKILDIIMDYVYRDESSKLEAIEDSESICHVLVSADQYLIPRLKTYCEYVLVNLLNLKNSCELLELSYIYNADQLKRCCLHFICINLQTLLESKSIDILSEEALNELTDCYQNLITRSHNRRIDRYSSAPTVKEFEQIYSLFSSDDDFNINIDEKKAILKQKAKTKRQSLNRQRNESNSSDVFDSEDIQTLKHSLSSPKEDSELRKCLDSEEKENKNRNSLKVLNEKQTNYELLVKPKQIKWGLSSTTIPPPISLKDIITQEEKQLTKISNLNPSVTQNSIPIPKQGFRESRVQRISETLTENQSISPKSFAQMAVSPPKPCFNPWIKTESHFTTDPVVKQSFVSNYPKLETIYMRDIVRAEEEEIQTLKAMKTKPLHIISIEDKAIEELLEYYGADSNPDEYITVERVVSRIAEPVWGPNHWSPE